MGKAISRIFEERLNRQYQLHPTLHALRPRKEVNQAFRRFYQQAAGLPFFCWHISEQEHKEKIDRFYKTGEHPCCWNVLISLPLDRKHQPKTLHHYQAYVAHKLGIPNIPKI
jgi:hypothetical protein